MSAGGFPGLNRLVCALTIDLDEIPCYRRIHGLPEREQGATLVYDVALERVTRFAAAHQLALTLFAIGADLQRPGAAERIAELGRAGHRVENHSFDHRYDLTRGSTATIRADVERAHGIIGDVTGRAPRGFRAPGYTVSDGLFDVLDALGYRFDSSVFPCPPYYVAKALAVAGKRLRGRVSAAVLDTPRVWLAPTRPYRPSRPWHRTGGSGLLELPIAVTPRVRWPVIGTSLVLGTERLAGWLVSRCAATGFVNLELHGLDFLAAEDGLGDLAQVQPDLRVPIGRKLRILSAAVTQLRRRGGTFVTLDEAADQLDGVR